MRAGRQKHATHEPLISSVIVADVPLAGLSLEVADGAMVGDHTVTLSVDPDESDARATLRVVEGLGKQFSFAVKLGRNIFDIDTASA